MSFDTDEKSVQDSRPIELFTFTVAGSVIATYTSYSRDVVYGGVTYTAKPVKRDPIQVVPVGGDVPGCTVEVAMADPVVQQFIGQGVPPQRYQITIVRLQALSGAVEQQWTGYVNQVSARGRVAAFLIAALTDSTITTQIPKVVVSRYCNHVLYDAYCQEPRVPLSATIVGGTGRTMVVSTVGGNPDQWFKFGEVQHTVTKERRSIISQVGTTLILDVAWPTTVALDPNIVLHAGCDHAVATCRDKFNNVVNFGGHPQVVSADWFFQNINGTNGAG